MKRVLFLLSMLAVSAAYGQFNYSHTNVRTVKTSYTDISGTGTAITMTNNESGNSAAAINIGFSFSFNGTVFTTCMIHADGILRFGSAAPGAHTSIAGNNGAASGFVFNSTGTSYQNIVMPFFMDLVQGAATPQYHVLTEGTAPNRITTLQWKNLRDNNNAGSTAQSQYTNLEFQVKLYETSNNIQIVYGNFTPSANASQKRIAQAGVKSNSTNFTGAKKTSAFVNWQLTDFYDPAAHNISAFDNCELSVSRLAIVEPGFGFIFYGRTASDINIAEAYTESKLVKNNSVSTQNRVLVRNEGTTVASNINVTMDITGANIFNQTIVIPSLAAGASQVVEFSSYSLNNTGVQQVKFTATTAPDNNPDNNEQTKQQLVTSGFNEIVADSLYAGFGIGFTSTGNETTSKILGTGTRKLMQVRLGFESYLVPVNIRILEDNGTSGLPGTVLHTSPALLTNADNEIVYNLPVPVTVTDNYYIGVLQTGTTNMVIRTALQYPVQTNRYYNGFGTSYTTGSDRGFMVMVKTVEENTAPDLGMVAVVNPACGYGNAEPVKAVLRNYAATTHDFSINPVTISGSAHNAATNTSFPFSFVKNTGTLAANAFDTVTVLPAYDFSARTTHSFLVKTSLPGDAESINDSISYRILSNVRSTKNFTDSVCPFTTVTLGVVANVYSSINWSVNGGAAIASNPLNFSPAQTSTVVVNATDYRGCVLNDTIIVPVRVSGLPPTPVISFTDTLLSFRNGFSDTLSVPTLTGHSIIWNGSGVIVNANTYRVSGFQQAVSNQFVYYRNTTTSCGGLADTITIRYAPGIVMNNNNNETVCDTNFYDPGGSGGNFIGTNAFTKTFYPATTGSKVKVSFYHIAVGASATIRIYDGETTAAPRITTLSGSSSTLQEFTASGANGALTIEFNANGNSGAGWLGAIRCEQPLQYITVQAGTFTSLNVWNSKLPGAPAFGPATRLPNKGDDSIWVAHNISLPASTTIQLDQLVVQSGARLTIPSSTSLALYTEDGSYALDVRGALDVNGFVFTGNFTQKGIINLSGNLQVFPSGSVDCDSIIINPTTQVPQLLGTGRISFLKMNSSNGALVTDNLRIRRGIELVQGIINTAGTNFIKMEASQSPVIIGGSATSHINGKLRWETFIRSTPLVFPLGKNGLYRKIELLPVQTSFDTPVEYEGELFNTAPPANTLPGTLTNVNQQWYHKLTLVAGASSFSNAVATIYYEAVDGVASGTRVAKDNNAGSWIDLQGTPSALPTGSITSNSFTSFSDFVLANIGSGSLPVTLVSFGGSRQNNDALLQWRTANEINLDRYELQRSENGLDFTTITSIAPGRTAYMFTDMGVFNSRNRVYYRLRSVDRDTRSAFSSIIRLQKQKEMTVTVYPNPAKDIITIAGLEPGRNLRLLAADGKVIIQKQVQVQSMQLSIGYLKPGFYLLQYSAEEGLKTIKLVKQ
jgi:hypothetical protein